MLGYTTEIDIKRKEVRTTFGKEVRTFTWDDQRFPLVEAMKVATEDAYNQIYDLLESMVIDADGRPCRDSQCELPRRHSGPHRCGCVAWD